jgi:hypothetical protein
MLIRREIDAATYQKTVRRQGVSYALLPDLAPHAAAGHGSHFRSGPEKALRQTSL